MNCRSLHSHILYQECIIKISPLYTVDHVWLIILSLTTTYIKSFEGEKSTDDHDCGNQIIVGNCHYISPAGSSSGLYCRISNKE